MKLFYHPISNNCRRVLATIYENDRHDVELELVDLMSGQHHSPEYLAINPNGKVPTLVDGDQRLWESNAIMQYLSSDSPLWPPSKVRYDIIRWQFWGVAHFGPAIGKVVGERLIKPAIGGGDPDEAIIAKGLEEFERFGGVLNAHLEGHDWLVGDHITLADLSIGASLQFAGAAGIDLGPFSNIARWEGQLEQRESWQKSAPPPLG